MAANMRTAWRNFECKPELLKRISFLNDSILVAPPSVEAWKALEAVLLQHGYAIRTEKTDSYNCRNIKGSDTKSLHSYGIALDVNWDTNPWRDHSGSRGPKYSDKPTQDGRAEDVRLGIADTDMSEAMTRDVSAIATVEGKPVFRWGGDFKTVKDAMHFELSVTPEEISAGIDWETVNGTRLAEEELAGTRPVLVNATAEEERVMSVESAKFMRCHEFVAKWEGGFVDHPDDPGGATNYGITIGVLSAWRGRPVSKQEVRDLSFAEARQIFHARYWLKMNCDAYPAFMALPMYSIGVLSGPSRSGRMLQQALNRQGAGLAVDGVIGPKTAAAIEASDLPTTSRGMLDAYEQFLRSLSTFRVFGKGWMNRHNDLRRNVEELISEEDELRAIPATVAESANVSPMPTAGLVPATVGGVLNAEAIGAVLSTLGTDPATAAKVDALLGVLEKAGVVKPAKGLTPVNAALGETVGKALDGKKTVIGVVALIASAFLPQFAPLFTFLTNVSAGGDTQVATDAVQNVQSILTPLASLFTGWGALGKIDKWMHKPAISSVGELLKLVR